MGTGGRKDPCLVRGVGAQLAPRLPKDWLPGIQPGLSWHSQALAALELGDGWGEPGSGAPGPWLQGQLRQPGILRCWEGAGGWKLGPPGSVSSWRWSRGLVV